MRGRFLIVMMGGVFLLSILGALPQASASSSPDVSVDLALSDQLASVSASERIYAVVGFGQPPSSADAANLRALGLTVVPYAHLPYAAVGGTRDQVAAIINVPDVTSLHHNRVYTRYAQPDVNAIFRDENAYGTGVTSVRAERAWVLGDTGQGITVAIIDTGLDASNPSLLPAPDGPTINNVQVLSDELLFYPDRTTDVYLEHQVSTDSYGHGTHVAGSVAGSGRGSDGFYVGMAPGAQIIGLDGLQCTLVSDVLGGCLVTILSSFDWVLEHRIEYNIRVETNSWGSGAGPFDPNDPIAVAASTLVANGITVLFAAGNSGPGAGTISVEAENPDVIAVAAADPAGGLADFSSRGYPGGVGPAIASPGHVIISTRIHTGGEMDIFTAAGYDGLIPLAYLPNYLAAQGTSMATPVAAGVAALVLSANPDLTPAQVKQILQASATPMLGYATFEVGAGYVNAEAAVRSVLGLPTKASRVKLPAQMSVVTDPQTGTVTVGNDYRASITGVGLAGFGHFPWGFPVYTADSLPITVRLHWETIQQYSVYTTGYRVTVYDPSLNAVTEVDTDFFTLSQGLTITIDAATRSSLTPPGGAYWYVDMVNFNPGWGVLQWTTEVQYPKGFAPPFKTTTIKPAHVTAKADRSSTQPGAGVLAQGTVTDANGDDVDGVALSVVLVDSLGNVLWTGIATSVNGGYSARVAVPPTAAAGAYQVTCATAGLTASFPLDVAVP